MHTPDNDTIQEATTIFISNQLMLGQQLHETNNVRVLLDLCTGMYEVLSFITLL